ncbi:cupredoxin domain-containing protein [Phycicoccus sonneratiae]|uniref:Cupredoxin domain-containing protein n=1 Tax=Phycicoccus sonneratiae TaxID=2807628 RepID=A0ABS2CPA7_9MICO|nr:cupredoxin domain-containing protein [Phycicoccus sonneraticus]MBM6401717.1 cupredoxin domain-containing protein [Phycicoccus sonneraticus]
MRTLSTVLLAAAASFALTGCGKDEGTVTDGAASGADTTVTVTSTDDACTLSATSATPGSVAFTVTNEGGQVTEFYLYRGEDIVGEVEDIGPGLTRTLTVDDLAAGTYTSACKPGMSGDGIRADFTVG